MNIINKLFLNIALLPAPVYERMGVNLSHLRAILTTKLIMDDRKPAALYQSQTKKSKPIKMATIVTMFISLVMGGLITLMTLAFNLNIETSLTFYFSAFFVMLSATLISDFTSVLIDVRDNFIILPKPVNDKTFFVARLLHIVIHISKILFPLSLPAIIYWFSEHGNRQGFAFIIAALFISLFSIFFINAFYLLILRVTTPQKFQSIISYIQILFAVVIYGSYQVLPRMMATAGADAVDVNRMGWMIAYPIYWFAALCKWIGFGSSSGKELTGAILGVVVPLAGVYVVVKFLAPSFNSRVALLTSAGGEKPATVKKRAQRRQGKSYAQRLAGIFTGSQAEKMGFLFCWKMAARSRDFKLKVYPSFGYLLVYAVIIFWNTSTENISEALNEQGIKGKSIVVLGIYSAILIINMALSNMIYSDKYKAAWIYYISPVEKPGEVIAGGAKSILARYYLPIVAVVIIAGTSFLGWKVIPQVVLGVFNVLLISFLMVYIAHKVFPFSLPVNNNTSAGNFIRAIFLLFITFIIGVVHLLFYENLPVVIILALLSVAATFVVLNGIRNTSWAAIKSRYQED